MITAHVLCTGLSLAHTWRRLGYGPVIGVNRAVNFTACDWLVAGDPCTFARITGQPLAGVVSFRDNLTEYVPKRWRVQRLAWEDLHEMPHAKAQWGIEMACLLARRLAGRERLHIAIFGCDRDPAKPADWDGRPAADTRDADRFQREAAACDLTWGWLTATTPTTITRITP